MIPIKGRKILIVGGAGFVGHSLALRLKELGANVEVSDSLAVNNLYSFQKNAANIPNAELYVEIIQQRLDLFKNNRVPFHEQDARDYHAMSELISGIRPDVLVHLAAVAHANVSNKDPYSTFDHSLRTLENTLDISRSPKLAVKQFIYFSSSMVYGNFENGFVTEESTCDPLGIYGALKFAGEKMVIAYNQVFNLPYTIIRPSALYGERCVRRGIGQIFIENALNGLDITINGDGSERLDFTHIEDLVSGMVKVIESENSTNQIFNITYGESRSTQQMAEILKQHFPGVKIHYAAKDKLMPDRGTLSVEKAKKLIGYNPEWPLDRGFVRYIKWYKELWAQRPKAPQRG
jgi:nucleoside-diphosphate-sugar epimerase